MALDHIILGGSELLPERIAGALRQAIVDGVLPPGTRLQEQEFARRLKVSRVPLREAFRVLEGEGMVAIQPHRGAVVSERSDAELGELFAVRAMFEAYAVRSLARERPPEALERLDAIVAEMKVAVRKGEREAYFRLAAAFHDALIAGSGNALLVRLYDQIRLNLRRYQAAMSEVPESPAQSIREHEKIVAAARAGEAEVAAHAAENHIAALVRRFEKARPVPGRKPASAKGA